MFDALTYQIMLDEIDRNVRKKGVINDTIGILITRPELPTGKDILNSLDYYHFRTGKSINFYLPGYGAYWNNDYPDGKIVTTVDDVNWSFSKDKESLQQISNTFGINMAKQISMESLLEKLPLGLGEVFTQEKYFCIRNM